MNTDDVFALTDLGPLDEGDAAAAAASLSLNEELTYWEGREEELTDAICESPAIVREYLQFMREQIDNRDVVIEWVASTITTEGEPDE